MMEKKKEHWVHVLAGSVLGLFAGVLVHDSFWSGNIIQICFGGVMGAMCTFFLIFCYGPGNIFGWYMDFLEKHFRDNVKNPFGFLYKPLGGCAYCHNQWVTIGIFSVMAFEFGVSWWLLLPTMFVSHLALTILDDLFWT